MAKKRRSLTDEDDEAPELTEGFFRTAKRARDVLPPELYEGLVKLSRGQRGKQKAPVKKPVTVRLDAEVVEYFKSTGAGWQSRINALLKAAVENLRP